MPMTSMPHDPVEPRLGERRELRPFHVDVGAAAMHGRADLLRRVGGDRRQLAAHRVRERDVRDEAAPEERADAALRPIEELIGDEDVERLVLLLQAADGARRQQPLDAQHLEAVDVRPEVELRRQKAMADAVPREKRHALPAQRADDVGTRRIAERRADRFSSRSVSSAMSYRPLPPMMPISIDVTWSCYDDGRPREPPGASRRPREDIRP